SPGHDRCAHTHRRPARADGQPAALRARRGVCLRECAARTRGALAVQQAGHLREQGVGGCGRNGHGRA
ncbi:hypothetical protein XarCFBP6762_21550, partial [Xanthomonas arboricola]